MDEGRVQAEAALFGCSASPVNVPLLGVSLEEMLWSKRVHQGSEKLPVPVRLGDVHLRETKCSGEGGR